MRRVLHEEELSKLEQESKNVEKATHRMSERALNADMRKRQTELEQPKEDDKWIFDCSVCGSHGSNYVSVVSHQLSYMADFIKDDDLHSITCEMCNVWQHSSCHDISREDAEHPDFHFKCAECIQKMEDANKPKIAPIKIRLSNSVSPKINGTTNRNGLREESKPVEPNKLREPGSFRDDGQQPNGDGHDISVNGYESGLPQHPGATSFPANPNGNISNLMRSVGIPLSKQPSYDNIEAAKYDGAAVLGNGSISEVATSAPLPSFHDANFSAAKVNGFYVPAGHSAIPSKQPLSSPPAKINGHSSPVRLPPPSTPNGHQDTQFNTKADSPIKHIPSSTTQTPAEIITGVISGFSPTKHDSPRPSSACSISRTQVIPPVTNMSPKISPTIMTPPSKKVMTSSPAPVMLSPGLSDR